MANCQLLPIAELRIYAQAENTKGAAKRFKKTATGKVKRHHSHLRHMLTSKDKKRKGKLRQAVLVSDADTPKIKRMIPY